MKKNSNNKYLINLTKVMKNIFNIYLEHVIY
jgi:hypothetical protein